MTKANGREDDAGVATPDADEFPVRVSWDAQRSLQEILDTDRIGDVGGVHFDLRHSDLPRSEDWHSPTGARPFGIVFPWDRADAGGDEALAGEVVTNGGSALGWPVAQIYEGDTVSVEKVVRFSKGLAKPTFVDDHDAHELWAYLRITRPDGTSSVPDQSIVFCARDAMGPNSVHENEDEDIDDNGYQAFIGDFRISFDKVGRRIARLSRAGQSEHQRVWLELAAKMHQMAVEEHEASEAEVSADRWPPWGLHTLLDLAAASGYALAKAENERLIPVAERGLKAQESQKAATLQARRRADPVRELARKEIRLDRNISQTRCARNVAAKMGRDQRSVERLIEGLFEWRELAGGIREKRARSTASKPRQSGG